MIPDHLIDKAIRAMIIFERKDPDDPCEQWRFGAYGLEVGVAIEAVAADIWDEAIDAAADQGTIQIPDNPYRASETA